jgi:hypothetical protein
MNRLTKTEQKYLTFLNDVYTQCNTNGEFRFSDLTDKHRISRRVSSLLIKEGRVVNKSDGRSPIYVWNTIKPNIHMVKHIQESIRKENKVTTFYRGEKKKTHIWGGFDLNSGQICEIVQLRDVKKKPYSRIAKQFDFSVAHLSNIYHAAKGSKTHRERLNGNLKEAIDEFLNNEVITTQVKAKPIKATTKVETIKVAPRMHPVVDSKQRSVVILWGLINIKF